LEVDELIACVSYILGNIYPFVNHPSFVVLPSFVTTHPSSLVAVPSLVVGPSSVVMAYPSSVAVMASS